MLNSYPCCIISFFSILTGTLTPKSSLLNGKAFGWLLGLPDVYILTLHVFFKSMFQLEGTQRLLTSLSACIRTPRNAVAVAVGEEDYSAGKRAESEGKSQGEERKRQNIFKGKSLKQA